LALGFVLAVLSVVRMRTPPPEALADALRAGWSAALDAARAAIESDEVPVGAAVLDPAGRLVAVDHDRKMAMSDPTAHAEILAMRAAAAAQGDWRLDGYTLLVTLEPCPMCAGAILMARIASLAWAADSPKFGALGGRGDVQAAGLWNHRVALWTAPDEVIAASMRLLKDYFARHRKKR